MRLLSLDFDPVYGGDDTTRSSFSHDTSVFDYDVVIWDPEASFSRYYTPSTYSSYYMALPRLSEHQSVTIRSDVKRRQAEFVDFIKSGRTLVVIARAPQRCYIDTGERTHSGTGRNRATTVHVAEFDLMSALPVPKECEFVKAAGSRIAINGNGRLQSVLKKYREHLRYEAFIQNPPGIPLASVAGTKRTVGSLFSTKTGGNLVIIPVIDLHADEVEDEDSTGPTRPSEDEDEDEDDWLEIAPQFQADLLDAIETMGSRSTTRPAWAGRYATREQQEIRAQVREQQENIEKARIQLATLQQQKEAAEARDQLFLGSGRALEIEVGRVFEVLGGVLTEPEPGRDDWKVSFPEGDAVVEVKGVSKSAAEKHAAQLEKWVAGSLEESGKSYKGILVVNTWREQPLAERSEADFPAQMLPYSVSRQHCLVTGLQLFVIRHQVESDPGQAEYWRRKILDTAGILDGCDDWQAVIRTDSEEVAQAEGSGSPDA